MHVAVPGSEPREFVIEVALPERMLFNLKVRRQIRRLARMQMEREGLTDIKFDKPFKVSAEYLLSIGVEKPYYTQIVRGFKK